MSVTASSNPREKTALRIPPESQRFSPEELIVEGKIDARHRHEENDHAIDISAVKMGDRAVFCGESAGGHGGECVVQGIVKCHTTEHQQYDFGNGDQHVDLPEGGCRIADPGLELVQDRAGHLCFEKLYPANAQKG